MNVNWVYFFSFLSFVFFQCRHQVQVFDLAHFPAFDTDKVVVIGVVHPFVLGQIAPELVLAYQIGFEQQVYRVVDGCFAHAIPVLDHGFVQTLYIEMLSGGVYFFQYGEPLGSLAQFSGFQELYKQLFYSFF